MSKMMWRQVMTAPHKITFEEVPLPTPRKGEALVQIMRIGICGSDIHVFHGRHPYTSYPVTQGHEISGRVIALGEGVRQPLAGQKVTLEPQVSCGACYPCTHGKYNLCEHLKVMGFQTTGAASEYLAVDARKLIPLPKRLSYDEGAMIEPLAVTIHACKRAEEIKGKKIAVLGAGPIGILLAQSLKAFGAAAVLITDISDQRLAFAKACGANFAVNTRDKDFAQTLMDSFGPNKADVIYDCAGNDTTMNQAILNARKGSQIILVAVYAGMATVDLAKLNDSELDLNTSMMYRHEDYLDAIRLVEAGDIRLKPLMSKHFAFKDYPAAYAYIDANRESTMKILIDVSNVAE